MTNYNDGEWHGWNGGECPVHPDSVVQTMIRSEIGKEWDDEEFKASGYRWNRCGDIGDIIAFRVVKEHKEPREFWVRKITKFSLNGSVTGYRYQECSKSDGDFLVREVIE